MSFWNFLFGKNRITTIQDEFFGEIRDCKGHFEGKKYFKSTNSEIEIFIPNDTIQTFHSSFFQDLEEKYESLKMPLKEKFEGDFLKNMDENFEIKDFDKEFTLTFISFPESENSEWDLSYDTIHDKNHIFTGHFNNWQLEYVNIDG